MLKFEKKIRRQKVKHGLTTHFVKAMNQNVGGFPCLKQNFLRISEAKIKERISVTPKIGEIAGDRGFDKTFE